MNRLLASILLALMLTLTSANAGVPPAVKMSNSGICHDETSQWYKRTKAYTAFQTLKACLEDGGRVPKIVSQPSRKTDTQTSKYNRSRDFGSWIDLNGNCLNTRHELLKKLSTGPTHNKGCRIIRGRWNDPYTGKIFTESKYVDIDHFVPLKWAWDHGASDWTQEKRVKFANDEVNLIIVDASANRQKGSKGPLNWLPSQENYRCEYITRFKRITLIYKLKLSPSESKRFDQRRAELCSR